MNLRSRASFWTSCRPQHVELPLCPTTRSIPTEFRKLHFPKINDNHVDDPLAEDMREVCVPRRFRARNDEEHPGHKLPPRVKRPPSRPWTGEAERSDRAGA